MSKTLKVVSLSLYIVVAFAADPTCDGFPKMGKNEVLI